jgi:hypothetical protein
MGLLFQKIKAENKILEILLGSNVLIKENILINKKGLVNDFWRNIQDN